ncbi:hypothetical protein PInf_023279 [Phytophthora infestans]|nr:hypothetical protein PInf_023279 [Phytophthora infestans]
MTDLFRLLKDASAVAGAFDAESFFNLDLDVIRTAAQDPFIKARFIARVAPRVQDPAISAPISPTASSSYSAAAQDVSDTSSEPRRMSRGPSGTSILAAQAKARPRNQVRPKPDPTVPSQVQVEAVMRSANRRSRANGERNLPMRPDPTTFTRSPTEWSESLQRYVQAAMGQFLAEQGDTPTAGATSTPINHGSCDVEMESVRGASTHDEYDPADLDCPSPMPADAATTAAAFEELIPTTQPIYQK